LSLFNFSGDGKNRSYQGLQRSLYIFFILFYIISLLFGRTTVRVSVTSSDTRERSPISVLTRFVLGTSIDVATNANRHNSVQKTWRYLMVHT